MDDDRQLLKRFVDDNSQAAFAALTARYLSLVYATCRRELGDDSDLAEDVTQAVFLILARKAPSLRRNVVLSGWLFQTARFAAKNARLQETRRQAAELKAVETVMEQQTEIEDAAWTEIEPLLNQSLAGLHDAERECVLLRFFQGMTFAEAGAALGLSEEAARKRVTRSLEKMRQFFAKNGVIVPAIALPVLLTAHAAKAAPAACHASIAKLIPSVLAGHTTAALTGSHAYQISQGAMKAMKIAQIKVAVGITTASLIGFSFYAASRAVTMTSSRPAPLLLYVPKPGHVLQQVPGKTLTAAQIAERCRQTYANLKTYQGTSTVNAHSIIGGTPYDFQSSASVQFVRPGKISAQGTDTSGHPFGYVSDGVTTEQTYPTVVNWGHSWQKVSGDEKTSSTEAAIAGATGIAQWAATTVPALLIGTTWGVVLPLNSGGVLDREVREDAVEGQKCYVLAAHSVETDKTMATSLWIDEKTFLVRRYVFEGDGTNPAVVIGGRSIPATTIKSRSDQRFTNERLNQPIPDSTFALPPVQ